jgi:hydrogenase expression/formation protein HypC
MCLAVPGRILEITERDMTRMAKVDFGGVVKDVCLAYLPDIEVGDYTIVHVGFAIQKLDEASARETLRLFENLGLMDEEFGDQWGRAAAEAGAAPPDAAAEPAQPAEPRSSTDGSS